MPGNDEAEYFGSVEDYRRARGYTGGIVEPIRIDGVTPFYNYTITYVDGSTIAFNEGGDTPLPVKAKKKYKPFEQLTFGLD